MPGTMRLASARLSTFRLRALCLGLGVSLLTSANALAADCVCHAVLACSADACHPAGNARADIKQSCNGTTISADAETRTLSLCAFGDCWKGKANFQRFPENGELWHGRLHRNDNSSQDPSDVILYLNDGVGLAQISDESGPMQMSLSCGS